MGECNFLLALLACQMLMSQSDMLYKINKTFVPWRLRGYCQFLVGCTWFTVLCNAHNIWNKFHHCIQWFWESTRFLTLVNNLSLLLAEGNNMVSHCTCPNTFLVAFNSQFYISLHLATSLRPPSNSGGPPECVDETAERSAMAVGGTWQLQRQLLEGEFEDEEDHILAASGFATTTNVSIQELHTNTSVPRQACRDCGLPISNMRGV